jgi:NADH:ubiquinone oxidoreductase subunit E
MVDQDKILEIIEKTGTTEDKLLEILLEIQAASELNYISQDNAKFVAEQLGLPLSRVYEVISFYSMLSAEPRAKHIIEVCKSSACHVRKGKTLVHMLEEILGVKAGEATRDKNFYIEEVNCFGACDIAPAIKIGSQVYGDLDKEKLTEIINSYRRV